MNRKGDSVKKTFIGRHFCKMAVQVAKIRSGKVEIQKNSRKTFQVLPNDCPNKGLNLAKSNGYFHQIEKNQALLKNKTKKTKFLDRLAIYS